MTGILPLTVFDDVTATLVAASGESWMLAALFALIVADAFFPLVPSETAVVALGTFAASAGTAGPNLWLIIPVAALGALTGDLLLFAIGRHIRLDRFALLGRTRVVRAIAWARRGLDRRAAALIMTARYVPFGRIAVALTAGTTGFPFRRYASISVIACCSWALYNVAVGALFGTWLHDNPLIAVAVSVAVAVGLGIIIDAVTRRFTDLRPRRDRAHRTRECDLQLQRCHHGCVSIDAGQGPADDDGADAVCWLDLVCDECGALTERGAAQCWAAMPSSSTRDRSRPARADHAVGACTSRASTAIP